MGRKLALVITLLFLVGCNRLTALQNIQDEAVLTGSGNTPTLEEVRTSVRRAVLGKTWIITDDSPNKMAIRLRKAKKTLDAVIDYNTNFYSITYKDSINLLYKEKGSKPYIHRRVNTWFVKLKIDINANLAAF